jgi:hypothetical protein
MRCPICSEPVDRSGEYVETEKDDIKQNWHVKCWTAKGGE